jgi:hypothetical protein
VVAAVFDFWTGVLEEDWSVVDVFLTLFSLGFAMVSKMVVVEVIVYQIFGKEDFFS